MPNETNKLVAKRSQIAGTAAIAIAILLGAFMFSQYRAQAAGVPAAPIDEHSVTALTSLDQAMESVAARVTPAVVNIAVTSKVSPDRAVSDDSQQEVPPGWNNSSGHPHRNARNRCNMESAVESSFPRMVISSPTITW